jgi:ubiquinone/menaquinone biosynthesis C-methylase UbiE
MEAYESFARVYDELMDNIPYNEWCEYILSLLKKYGVDGGLICELGCGTGTITQLLAQSGYDMIGIDNSYDMLEIANEKKNESGLPGILYLNQDMRDFELFGTVNAIICVCDSINYLTDKQDITQVFRLANNYLESGGIFICDFKTRHYFKDIVADSTIAEDREDVSFIWDNFYDEESDINELFLSLFIPELSEGEKISESTLYHKYQEAHYQRGLTIAEMKQCVAASGMELVAVFDAFTYDEADENSQRVYIVARETHQDNKYYE